MRIEMRWEKCRAEQSKEERRIADIGSSKQRNRRNINFNETTITLPKRQNIIDGIKTKASLWNVPLTPNNVARIIWLICSPEQDLDEWLFPASPTLRATTREMWPLTGASFSMELRSASIASWLFIPSNESPLMPISWSFTRSRVSFEAAPPFVIWNE